MIKFALIQQAAQCLLGYWMSDDTEQFIPHEYVIAAWAQKIRCSEALASQWIRYLGFGPTWIPFSSKGCGYAPTVAFTHSRVGNSSQDYTAQFTIESLPYSSLEMMTAKCVYWILVPLFQYVSAMVLADTFQYFTHRAFHVNKWLYSELPLNCSFMTNLTNVVKQSIFTRCIMIYTCLLRTVPSTIIHWRPSR